VNPRRSTHQTTFARPTWPWDTSYRGEHGLIMSVAARCAAPMPKPSHPTDPSPQSLVCACRLGPWVTRRPPGSLACARDALVGRRVVAACSAHDDTVASGASSSSRAVSSSIYSALPSPVSSPLASSQRGVRAPSPWPASPLFGRDRRSASPAYKSPSPASQSSSPLSSSTQAPPGSPNRSIEAPGLELDRSSAARPLFLLPSLIHPRLNHDHQ
jgi:hypothetical protein